MPEWPVCLLNWKFRVGLLRETRSAARSAPNLAAQGENSYEYTNEKRRRTFSFIVRFWWTSKPWLVYVHRSITPKSLQSRLFADYLPHNLVGSHYDIARLYSFIGRWLGERVVYDAANEFMDSEMHISSSTQTRKPVKSSGVDDKDISPSSETNRCDV